MRKRRNQRTGLALRAAGAVAILGVRLCARAARRPIDSIAIVVAVAVSLIIIINAAFLQSGAHPAPFFVNQSPPPLPRSDVGPALAPPRAPTFVSGMTQPPRQIAVRRNDPIAELIGPSPRITAVQRVLSDYGYGQITQSGMLDPTTSAAIERFEREHHLPITGRVSDRLVNELTTMIGHPLD